MGYVVLNHKLKCFVNSFIIIALSFVLGTICVTIALGLLVQTAKLPRFLGNKAENVAHVSTTTDPNEFTFIVTGDVKHGTATFEAMLDIMEQDKPAFVVIVGDFVSYPTSIGYRLFGFEMAEHVQDFPIFLVLGNHDLELEDKFDMEDYESLWGPSEFFFTIGKNLFVLLNNNPPNNRKPTYFEFLEEALEKKAKEVEHIFIFMHIPPFRPDASLEFYDSFGNKEFLDIVKKYHVDYVFSGHHHGYMKTEKEGTTFIVTGGGGGRLRGEHGGFHHLTRIALNNGTISETVVAYRKYAETLELIENNLVVYVWAPMTQNAISIVITLTFCATTVWLLIASIRSRCRLRGNTSRNSEASVDEHNGIIKEN